VFNCFSVARRVTKKITVVHADHSAQGESKIADDYNIDSLLLAPFGSVRITYIPRYVKYFKSFDPPALPLVDLERFPAPVRYGFFRSLMLSIREQKGSAPLLETSLTPGTTRGRCAPPWCWHGKEVYEKYSIKDSASVSRDFV
jgi:hypothetical protein